MPTTTTNTSVQRHNIADYLNTGTAETPKWSLMGTGFTTLDESPSAQVKESRYINQASSSRTTTGYSAQFPFTSDLIVSEEPIKLLYEIGTEQKTGGDCELSYLRVELFNPVSGSENTYRARLIPVAAEISSINTSDGQVQVSGNLNQIGNITLGSFNVETSAFVADSATAAASE